MLHVNTLILHLGSWKTGTTSIQSFLARNAARLKGESILYPRTTRDNGTVTDSAHHRLCATLESADGRMTRGIADILDELVHELRASKAGAILLSSETFMGMHRPETLARYFTADRVIIVVNLSHQAELLNAMYSTEVRHLKVIDQPMEYFAGFDRRKLNYLATLDRWAKIWLGAEMRVALFDYGTSARIFPVKHFLGQIGLDWELGEQDNVIEQMNPPAQATIVMRQLAASGYSDLDLDEVFQLFQRHREFFSPIMPCFPPQVMRNIETAYAEQNRHLVAKYLPEGSAGFAQLDLPDPIDWSRALSPSGDIFPAFVRSIAREAAAQIS